MSKDRLVLDTIDAIESRPAPVDLFIPTRYPYTYAWDYVRAHSTDFGFAGLVSRGQVSAWGRDLAPSTVEALADAYLRETNTQGPVQ